MQFLEDTLSIVERDACVLMDLEDNTFISYNLITNLRAMNHNLVFNYKTYEKVKTALAGRKIYFITSEECEKEEFQLVSEKNYVYTGEFYSLDVIYPREIGRASQKVYVYCYQN